MSNITTYTITLTEVSEKPELRAQFYITDTKKAAESYLFKLRDIYNGLGMFKNFYLDIQSSIDDVAYMRVWND